MGLFDVQEKEKNLKLFSLAEPAEHTARHGRNQDETLIKSLPAVRLNILLSFFCFILGILAHFRHFRHLVAAMLRCELCGLERSGREKRPNFYVRMRY